jgi:hypothetical protein
MRTTIDIPDPIFRELKLRAASEGRSLREIVLEGVGLRLNGASSANHGNSPRFPVIRSSNPGSLKLGEEGVYEYIPFP